MLRLGEEVTSDGRSFHTEAPATGNARSPMVDSLVRGTWRRCVDAERRLARPKGPTTERNRQEGRRLSMK
jgi:hypothetical protein